jgi:hypothetical protein
MTSRLMLVLAILALFAAHACGQLVIDNNALNSDILFKVNDGGDKEVMRINTTQLGLGIGTVSPSAGLQVVRQGANTIFESGAANDARLEFRYNNGTRIGFLSWNSSLLTLEADGPNGSDISFNAGYQSRMYIDNYLGYVGIGTTSPVARLDIRGSSTYGYVRMDHDASSGYVKVDYNLDLHADPEADNPPDFRNIRFFTAGTEKARIDATGNIGIGTTAPVGKLDVVTTATNDNPIYSIRQARIATTDITETLQLISTSADHVYMIEARVVARCTSSTAGNAGKGAGYVIRGTYRNSGGTLSPVAGGAIVDYMAEDVGGWGATLDTSGMDIRVRVTGLATDQVTWHATTSVQYLEQ